MIAVVFACVLRDEVSSSPRVTASVDQGISGWDLLRAVTASVRRLSASITFSTRNLGIVADDAGRILLSPFGLHWSTTKPELPLTGPSNRTCRRESLSVVMRPRPRLEPGSDPTAPEAGEPIELCHPIRRVRSAAQLMSKLFRSSRNRRRSL